MDVQINRKFFPADREGRHCNLQMAQHLSGSFWNSFEDIKILDICDHLQSVSWYYLYCILTKQRYDQLFGLQWLFENYGPLREAAENV